MSEAVPQSDAESPIIKAAFGEKNRNRLIGEYFAGRNDHELSPDHSWEHIYRLLLWTDPTTGLAHCYESDKCQPGKNWYARSLAFHDWLSSSFRVQPLDLGKSIDWLFLKATSDLSRAVARNSHRIAAIAEQQMQPYADRNFPKPGEDVELIALVEHMLVPFWRKPPSTEFLSVLVQRVRQYLSVQNKRKNLVGEGFEDVLAHVVRRACPVNQLVQARCLLHGIPGFNRAREGEKPNKVDLAAVVGKARVLISAKWSLRADREKQFVTDYHDYTTAESSNQPFQYVFITNEFDPARLVRACEKMVGNSYMFNKVVHINTDALAATYGEKPEETMRAVLRHIGQGRLTSMSQWLREISSY